MIEETKPAQDLSGYLTGQFLLAMPHIQDPYYEKTVIYICAHNKDGAMGLVVNKQLGNLTLKGLLKYLNLPKESINRDLPIYCGGNLHTGRGFVVHSDDFTHVGMVPLGHHMAVSSPVDVLQSIAKGNGPRNCLLAMGYVGWEPHQLDTELHGNRWLQSEADFNTLFHVPIEQRWEKAIAKFGITPETLSEEVGQA